MTPTPLLNQILKEYGHEEKCKIRDPAQVENTFQRLVTDGPSKLQVITDFDFTLTRFHLDGERCCSAHKLIDDSPLMPPEYAVKRKALVDKYVPIEIDQEMSIEEKTAHIITWFRKSYDLLFEYKLTKDKIREMVKTGKTHLRDLARDVLTFLNFHEIPCLVFSAGLGEFLEELLYRDSAFFPNMKIVANYMDFNETDESVSIKEPLIHVFNKNEIGVNDPTYFKQVSERSNALVLGDSLGDVGMSKGMQKPGAIFKIGFLNDNINELMESYLNSYDVILVDDQSFKFVDLVLKKIVSPQ